MTEPVSNIQLARVVEQTVRLIAGVADLDAGAVGEFATYGGGDRVRGVRAQVPRNGAPARVAVRLVVRYGYPLPELTDRIRATIRETVREVTGTTNPLVDLHVVDVRPVDVGPVADAPELPAGAPTLPSG